MPGATYPNSGVLDKINYYVMPQIVDAMGKAEHLGYRMDPVQAWIWSKAKRRNIGHSASVTHRVALASGTVNYKYLDTITPVEQPGGYKTLWYASNWATPIQISEEEIMETSGNVGELVPKLQDQALMAQLDHARKVFLDLVRGNAQDSTLPYGLEQVFYPKTHLNSGGTTATSLAIIDRAWKTRQANNAIGGITRTAHTDFESVGGTGLENYSIDYFSDAANVLGYSSGAPTVGLKVLLQAIQFANRESGTKIDAMLSTPKVLDDYLFAAMEKTTVNREVSSFEGGQLAHSYSAMKFMNLEWVVSEFLRAMNDFSGIADDTQASNTIYLVDSNGFEFVLDPRMDRKVTQPLSPLYQFGQVQYIKTRASTVVRRCPGVRIFDYPA